MYVQFSLLMEFKDILFLTSYVNNQTSYKYNLYTVGGLNNIAKKNYQTHTLITKNVHTYVSPNIKFKATDDSIDKAV